MRAPRVLLPQFVDVVIYRNFGLPLRPWSLRHATIGCFLLGYVNSKEKTLNTISMNIHEKKMLKHDILIICNLHVIIYVHNFPNGKCRGLRITRIKDFLSAICLCRFAFSALFLHMFYLAVFSATGF